MSRLSGEVNYTDPQMKKTYLYGKSVRQIMSHKFTYFALSSKANKTEIECENKRIT